MGENSGNVVSFFGNSSGFERRFRFSCRGKKWSHPGEKKWSEPSWESRGSTAMVVHFSVGTVVQVVHLSAKILAETSKQTLKFELLN